MYSQFTISGSTLSPKPPALPKDGTVQATFGANGAIKRCARPLCQTVFTPQWRRGPSGKADYCNACGLKYANDLSTGKWTPVVQKISNVSINSLSTATLGAPNQVSSLPTYTPEEKETREKMQISRILN